MKLSIVSTLFNSERFLMEFCQRITNAAHELVSNDFELILVNDGSSDDSLLTSSNLMKIYPQIKIVDLSRNFGHHAAIVAGLSLVRGERVFLIDSDLEENPEWLIDFWKLMENSHSDVIFGVRRGHNTRAFGEIMSRLFWKVINSFSDQKFEPNQFTVRLMSKRYVESFLSISEKNLFLAGIFCWVGFSQVRVPLEKNRLNSGSQTYNLKKRVQLGLNALVSFSSLPLKIVFWAGSAICLISILVILITLALRMAGKIEVSGFTTVVVLICFFGGFAILAIGLVGLYVESLVREVKSRPRYIIKSIHKERFNDEFR
jgi:putative glycosyltransferase